MGPASIFAQVATTDSTSQEINALIISLLVVAFLLACLTVWYWRHTDPARRTRVPIPLEVPAPSEPIVLPLEPEDLADTYAQDEGMSVDEWLSLTGPESKHQN